jgi:hypothetical protein
MSGIDIGFAVRAQDQEVRQVGVRHQHVDQAERGAVCPLQVVEEQDERVLRRRERRDEAAHQHAVADLGLAGSEVRHGRLRAQHQAEGRDQIRDETGVRRECIEQSLAPPQQLPLAAREQPPRQLVQRVDERAVRDVALVLVELAFQEDAVAQRDGTVDLADQRGLADARLPRHEQRGAAAGRDTLEDDEQLGDLGLAAVEAVARAERARDIGAAQREQIHDAGALELVQAMHEIDAHAIAALIALLRRLGQQLHDHGGQARRYGRPHLVRWGRLSRELAVKQFERVRRLERRPADQHFVERAAQRVQVGAVVDAPVRPARLFRRHVRERTLEPRDIGRRAALPRKTARDAEIRKTHVERLGIHDDVGRLDVLVDDPLAVDLAQDGREADAGAAHGTGVGRFAPQELLQRDATGILEDQDLALRRWQQLERAHDAVGRDGRADLVLVTQDGGALRGRCRKRRLQDDRTAVRLAASAPDGEVPSGVQLFDDLMTGEPHPYASPSSWYRRAPACLPASSPRGGNRMVNRATSNLRSASRPAQQPAGGRRWIASRRLSSAALRFRAAPVRSGARQLRLRAWTRGSRRTPRRRPGVRRLEPAPGGGTHGGRRALPCAGNVHARAARSRPPHTPVPSLNTARYRSYAKQPVPAFAVSSRAMPSSTSRSMTDDAAGNERPVSFKACGSERIGRAFRASCRHKAEPARRPAGSMAIVWNCTGARPARTSTGRLSSRAIGNTVSRRARSARLPDQPADRPARPRSLRERPGGPTNSRGVCRPSGGSLSKRTGSPRVGRTPAKRRTAWCGPRRAGPARHSPRPVSQ